MKKNHWKQILTTTTLAAMLAANMTACHTGERQAINTMSKTGTQTGSEGATGLLLLSINPEIELKYDADGLILEIEGRNEDGKAVLAEYRDYRGKDCQTVASELVQRIYEKGYFEKTVDGHVKNIVVKVEHGSASPSDEFVESVADRIRDTVKEHHIASEPMIVREKDLDQKGNIGLEKAKELAMAQLGLDEAAFTERNYDLDDDVYELEFISNGIKYEFEVDAKNGKVKEADYEKNDDWMEKDDDSDDKDDNDGTEDVDDQDDDADDNDDADDQADDVDDKEDDADDKEDADDQTDDIDDKEDADDQDDDVDDNDDADDQAGDVDDNEDADD